MNIFWKTQNRPLPRPRELSDTRLRSFGTACQRTLVAQPHPGASNNCLRLNILRLHSAANLLFMCIRVILTDESLHVKPTVRLIDLALLVTLFLRQRSSLEANALNDRLLAYRPMLLSVDV